LRAADFYYVKENESGQSTIITLLRQEPEGSRLVLKVAGSGAVALVVWTFIGPMFLSAVVTLTITVLGLAAYAAALVFLTASLVKQVDRWELEAAQQASQLIGASARPRPRPLDYDAEPVEKAVEPVEAEPEQGPVMSAAERFHQMYFALRLEQEVRRCRMQGETLSAVVVRVELPPGKPVAEEALNKLSFDVAKLTTDYATAVTIPSCIGPNEYAFCLVNVGHDEAKLIVAPLLKPLGNYHCEMGIASYPEDDGSADALIKRARQQLDLNTTLARSA